MRFYFIFLLALLPACTRPNNRPEMDTITVIDNLVIDETSVPIFPKKAAVTTDTARMFSLDLPKRCRVDWDVQTVMSNVPAETASVVRLDAGDPLPDLKVEDFKFENITAARALSKLLDSTDIMVIENGIAPVKITGEVRGGPLSDAVALISKMGGTYYSYDAEHKEIILRKDAKWLVKMPKSQDMTMALIDAMRGADIAGMHVNWEDKTLSATGNVQTERRIAGIISDMAAKKFVLAWDMDVYRIYPRTENPIIWMNMLPALGDRNIKMSISGVVGRALVVSPEINTKTLQQFMSQQGNVVLISQGTFSVPNGWQARFDIGQCSREDRLETNLIVGAQGKYGDYGGKNKIDAKIVLRTRRGELSSFEIPSNPGDNYVIIGIPTHSFVKEPETLINPYAELVIFMSPRIISIIEADNGAPTNALSGDELRDFLRD